MGRDRNSKPQQPQPVNAPALKDLNTVGDLIAALQAFDRNLPVKLEMRYRTGYDQGEIYNSILVSVREFQEKVLVSAEGVVLAGGW